MRKPLNPLPIINLNNDYIVPQRALYSNLQDSVVEAPDTAVYDSIQPIIINVKDIPKPEVNKEKPKKEKGSVYVVKKGDTLNNISKRYGTTIDKLCGFNNIKKDDILSLGQKIKIPK